MKIKTEEKSSDGIILSRNRLVGTTTGERQNGFTVVTRDTKNQ